MRTLTLVLFLLLTPSLWSDEYFAAKVEPLLREHCYQCHSHGQKMRAGLALDSRSGWELGGDSGPAVVPGKPEESLLMTMVNWADDDHQMPPKEKLHPEKIAQLEEWIRRGAPDPRKLEIAKKDPLDWWSLKTLVRPQVPSESAHPIDAFVQAKLAANQIESAPLAGRRTLIRRLYLNLHGLLPTPEEVEAFVKDSDPKAYEKMVAEMLESPQYGERWARHWLDVIHFADSHGCEHDVKRPNAWRFRDYVIERLNADVPWPRFVREQLAADVFFPNEPNLTPALGFIAAGPLELSRANTAPVTFDYLDRDDMVTQTMAAFVSTTANCARCHTHKFDPITQEDYYALQAVFAGVGKGDIEYDSSVKVMNQRREWDELMAAVAGKDASVLLQKKYANVVHRWVTTKNQQKIVKWILLEPETYVANGATLSKEADNSIFATPSAENREFYTITSKVDLGQLAAVRLDVLKDDRLPKGGPGLAGNGNLHLSEVAFRWFPAGENKPVSLKVLRASASFDQNGWTAPQAIDGDLQSGWAIHPRVNESHHIVFEFAEPIDLSGGGKLAVTLKQLYPAKHHIGRFQLLATHLGNGAAQVLPGDVVSGLQKPLQDRTHSESIAVAAAALEEFAKRKIAELPAKQMTYGVSSSWSHAKKLSKPQEPKVVHLLSRGSIEKPVREVGPGALAAISGLPARFELSELALESARRAALANWIVHPDNPLTWRSIVNRVWHYHFGRGLCDTPNDFGRMGSEPSHPELLDWLAVWFRDEAKGSLKELHKLILTSHTWRQSSIAKAPSVDSDNRLLWRQNRRRLDAEAFRDSVLRLSGRLDSKMGGPGIEQFKKMKGPQATPALDYSGFDWNSEPAKRRSIYRVVWRGIPDPFMEALDFPDMALLTPKRGFSVSALQSLSLYNNDFVLHASGWLAEKLEREYAKSEQVRQAVRLCWQREPADSERGQFEAYLQSHGLAALCRVLLNSNELLFVD